MHRCVHCGSTADLRIGGRPKCKSCTLVRVVVVTVSLVALMVPVVIALWGR